MNKIAPQAETLNARPSSDALLAVLKAPDWDSLRLAAQALLTPLGVGDFMLKMDIGTANETMTCHYFGSLPASLMELFGQPNASPDPVQQHLVKTCRPLAWQVAQLCVLQGGAAYPLLKKRGVNHGLSMAVRGEQSCSRVDFYGKPKNIKLDNPGVQADALLLATYLHEAVGALWRKQSLNHAPRLSLREIECLKWSAQGKNSQEIGQLLGISYHTVYFHLKNASAKLGVYGARHTVSQAIALGILRPDNVTINERIQTIT